MGYHFIKATAKDYYILKVAYSDTDENAKARAKDAFATVDNRKDFTKCEVFFGDMDKPASTWRKICEVEVF